MIEHCLHIKTIETNHLILKMMAQQSIEDLKILLSFQTFLACVTINKFLNCISLKELLNER